MKETIAQMVTKQSIDILSIIFNSIKEGADIDREETNIIFTFYDNSTITVPVTVILNKTFKSNLL